MNAEEEHKITKNNILIAEFMREKVDQGGMSGYDWDDLEYNFSWEWLMPVVEKIQNMGYLVHMNNVSTNINNNGGGTELKRYFKTGYNSSHGDMKKRTYKAVVEFIKWYNENVKDERN